MTPSTPDTGRSPAVRRAAKVLTELSVEPEGLSVADLARRLEAPKSSLNDLCGTLCDTGLVSRTADGRIRLGPQIARLARGFVDGTSLLEDFEQECAGFPAVHEHVVLLGTLVGPDVVYLAVRGTSRPMPLTLRAGLRLPAWATATGMVMLSTLTDEEIADLHEDVNASAMLNGKQPRLNELMGRINETRTARYATDDGMGDPALSGVAALVAEHPLIAVGLISPAGSRTRHRDTRLVRTLAVQIGTGLRQPAR
jgi:DNA-binding IclR family transcriptional regulator